MTQTSSASKVSTASQTGWRTKTRVPAVEGLHTMEGEPRLIGGKVPGRETYFFPKHLARG